MLDSEYFRTILQADVDAVDGPALVELLLTTGQTLRLRAVVSLHNEFATLEAYRDDRLDGSRPPRWKAEPAAGQTRSVTLRAVVAYGGMVAVTITPDDAETQARTGFLRT